MLQRFADRQVNLSLAIGNLRAFSSVEDRSVGWTKQEASSTVQPCEDVFFSWSSRMWVCSHESLGSCRQCSPSLNAGRPERNSDHTSFFNCYGSRGFSTTVAKQSSDLTNVAWQRYLTIIQVCEILETRTWGEETANHLQDLNLPFTPDIVVTIIRAVSSPTTSLSFFKWLTLNDFKHDAFTYGAMLDVLGKGGFMEDMKMLMSAMCEAGLIPDSGLYDTLIHWCVHHGDANGASSFLEKMKEEGFTLSALTYTSMLDLHMKEARYEDAVTTYLQMVEESVIPNSGTLTLLIRCLLEAGKLDSAQKIYSSLPNLKMKPSSTVFAYLMSAHAKVGNLAMLKSLGKEMRDMCSRPGEVFCVALNSLLKEGKTIEAESFAKEVWPELTAEERNAKAQCVGNVSTSYLKDETKLQDDSEHLVCIGKNIRVALLDTLRLLESEGVSVLQQVKVHWTADMIYKTLMHLKNSDLAWEFFNWVKSAPGHVRDSNNEVLMLRMLVKSSNFLACKELLSELQSKGDLSVEIFNILIKECVMIKNARAAMWVYSRIKDSGLLPDEETFSLLVQAFARGRNPDKASDLCSVMQDVGLKPDVETYTAVIHSLGLAGRSDDAWSVYQRMLAMGLKPNVNTYTALMNMLNMTGDTEFGIKIFKEMNDKGISPTEATQGIMAMILEASGNHAESQKLKTQLKFLSSKRREDSLQHIYEILLEGLVEQERSPSLSSLS